MIQRSEYKEFRDPKLETRLMKLGYTNPILVGRGSYGLVYLCTDERNKKEVIIKTIRGLFENLEDTKRIAREAGLDLLVAHDEHTNINQLAKIIQPDDLKTFTELSLVFAPSELDLKNIIESHFPLSPEHVECITAQMFNALMSLHERGILHRDLKPGNFLVDTKDYRLTLIDFGLGKLNKTGRRMSQDVITKWYIPPELLFPILNKEDPDYGHAVDMWSCGIILLELLFRLDGPPPNLDWMDWIRGKADYPFNHFEHLKSIFMCVGAESDLRFINTAKHKFYFSNIIKHTGDKNNLKARLADLKNRLRQKMTSEQMARIELACDLVMRMLVIDPEKRITIKEALKHPYARDYQPDAARAKPMLNAELRSCLTALEEETELTHEKLRDYMVTLIQFPLKTVQVRSAEEKKAKDTTASLLHTLSTSKVATSAITASASTEVASEDFNGHMKPGALTQKFARCKAKKTAPTEALRPLQRRRAYSQ